MATGPRIIISINPPIAVVKNVCHAKSFSFDQYSFASGRVSFRNHMKPTPTIQKTTRSPTSRDNARVSIQSI